ncbi:M48 family metallopeptidase [Stenotrophomonas sp. SY1]|uniref:M48 family metallopeptidase n=1 Tax=Stenotrophomonas sp. SY1 TaxID=477235 RepID=UPI001E47F928|nr:M48 family metallopeptidase [Stenotrophomonas sp. SY1]MCD9086280.1 M48 family metallopeptidase [Stenotrophomonas sp. SY1]
MNFFEHQAQARRNSGRLLLLFALAVIAIVAVIDVLVLWVSGSVQMALWSTLVTVAVIGLASLYRVSKLRGGGEVVALQMGGTEVPANTTDPALRRLRNVVEEIAIASGVPMPRLYVLEQEPGINAFAAGYSPADAAIAVTRGTLQRLNRDELQGVIAHEFSHILNGDMRLNIRLMGVLFGILMISVIGRRVLMHMGAGSRVRSGRTLGPVVALLIAGLVAMAIGSIGVLLGRLIKAAVSRQREVLADASAVQFTRQTQGLAGALKKIGGLPDGSRLVDRAGAEEVSHMLFGEGLGFSRWFATHPPLVERIQRLEPAFNAAQLQQLRGRWFTSPPDGMAEDMALGLVPTDASATRAVPPSLPGGAESRPIDPAQVAAQVATPGDDDYQQALRLAGNLPVALRELARDKTVAPTLLLALLRDGDAQVAARQREAVRAQLGADVAEHMQVLADGPLRGLHAALRLPLATLAFPALRAQPRPQLQVFLQCIDVLAHADGRISLFEYCLSRLLQVQVQAALDPSRHLHFGRRKTISVRQEFATLLAVVAWAGNPGDTAAARRAYLAGLHRILPQDHLPYVPPAAGVLALDAVWEPLDALDPLAKQVLVESVAATVSHNQRISVAEAELLRTICGALHCPLPALLAAA